MVLVVVVVNSRDHPFLWSQWKVVYRGGGDIILGF